MSLKILQLGKFYPIRGGVERVMVDLTIGLNRIGVHCDMMCVDRQDEHCDDYDRELLGNHLIICKKNKEIAGTMLSISMIRMLRKLCNKYDIVHIHHPDPMATLSLFLSGYKGKVVLHWHSDIIRQKILLKLYKPLQSWLINRANIILGTTPTYIESSPFLQNYREKIDYLLIGIDRVYADKQLVHDIKQKYLNKKIIYSIGRFVQYKGFEYLINAAKDFDDNTVLLIGGSGPLLEKYRDKIKTEGLKDKVILLGFLSEAEKMAYFEVCDIFCLSSILKTEAYAIVQLEAMSCSKPVVSTDIPGSGVPWVNKHEESGLIVPPCDTKSMSNAIQSLIKDISLYDKVSIGAFNRYTKLFRKETMIDNIYKIYNRIK